MVQKYKLNKRERIKPLKLHSLPTPTPPSQKGEKENLHQVCRQNRKMKNTLGTFTNENGTSLKISKAGEETENIHSSSSYSTRMEGICWNEYKQNFFITCATRSTSSISNPLCVSGTLRNSILLISFNTNVRNKNKLHNR